MRLQITGRVGKQRAGVPQGGSLSRVALPIRLQDGGACAKSKSSLFPDAISPISMYSGISLLEYLKASVSLSV